MKYYNYKFFETLFSFFEIVFKLKKLIYFYYPIQNSNFLKCMIHTKPKFILLFCFSLLVHIFQKFRKIEKFWNQLFDIIWRVHQKFPCLGDRMKLTISYIKSEIDLILLRIRFFYRFYKVCIHICIHFYYY